MGCSVSSQDEPGASPNVSGGIPLPVNSASDEIGMGSSMPAMASDESTAAKAAVADNEVPPTPDVGRSVQHITCMGSATRQRLGKKGHAFTSIFLPDETQTLEDHTIDHTIVQEGSGSIPEAAATVAGFSTSLRRRESRESSQNSNHERSPFSPRDPKSGPCSPTREGARVRTIQFLQEDDGPDCPDPAPCSATTRPTPITATTVLPSFSDNITHLSQSGSTHEVPVL